MSMCLVIFSRNQKSKNQAYRDIHLKILYTFPSGRVVQNYFCSNNRGENQYDLDFFASEKRLLAEIILEPPELGS